MPSSAEMDTSPILDGLNPGQKAAVISPSPVVQILAPPGSGKTKTLTSRVSWLLFHHKYKPWNVICLTFTIKSAREMKERIAKQIGKEIESKLILGTFHSVCLRYLRHYGHLIGLRKGFGIADASDSQAIINRIVKLQKLTLEPRAARSRISHSKAKNVSYEELLAKLGREKAKKTVDQREFLVLFEAYQSHLASSNLLDYDDILTRCVELFVEHPECVSNVEAMLIDEFQDTNNVQFDLMRLFASENKRVTTVGDPDQSIYGWRSAEIANLGKMQRLYPDTLVLNLEHNYRSSGLILKAAQELIEQDISRPEKSLVPTHCYGVYPVLRRLFSTETQAQWIVAEIQRCRATTGYQLFNFSDFAILIRSASQSRQIETDMGRTGIPYRMVGGLRFFDRVEIKILLDYLRVINQPENSEAVSRVINLPRRGVGEATIKSVLEQASQAGKPLWELLKDSVQGKRSLKLSAKSQKGIESFFDIIMKCRKSLLDETKHTSPRELLYRILNKTEFKKFLEKDHPEDHENRWANVEELVAQASEYDCAGSNEGKDETDTLPQLHGVEQQTVKGSAEALSNFLANIALSTELQAEDEADEEGRPRPKVTLSTIHAAKGLEWPVVFIPSTFQGSIPHSRAEDSDEERRLLYVAMTRAQALLYLSWPTRSSNGEESTLSSFLSEGRISERFTKKGPSMSEVIEATCSILGREKPLQSAIDQGLQSIECVEDDVVKWPVNGERGYGRDGDDDSDPAYGQESKRRKISHESFALSLPRSTSGNSLFESASAGLGALASPGFPASSGFTTAARHMRTHTQAERGTGLSTQTTKSQSRKPSHQGTSRSSAKMAGQTTLLSTWNLSTRQLEQPLEVAGRIAGTRSLESLVEVQREDLRPSYSFVNTEAGISPKPSYAAPNRQVFHRTALTISHENTEEITRSGFEVEARRPLPMIPEELAKHRIGSGSVRRWRSAEIEEPSSDSSSYLSLSTAKQDPTDNAVKARGAGVPEIRKPSLGNTRPVETMHETTLSIVQTKTNPSRRSYGIGRNLSAWKPSAFSIPKISRPGSG